jgi:hypothetical protein
MAEERDVGVWNELLVQGCEMTDEDRIREALAHGADPNLVVDDESNETALFKMAWMVRSCT